MRTTNNQQPRMSSEALAAWLLESGEYMPDTERNARPANTKALQARVLSEFMATNCLDTDLDFAHKADVSPATLSKFKNIGAPKLNKQFQRVARTLGLDAKALFQGKIVRVDPIESIPDDSDIVSLAKRLRGHPDEEQIKRQIEKVLASGPNRKARSK